MDHQEAVEEVVAQQLRPMVDQDLSLVFYDLTTIGVEGHIDLAGDVLHYGMSKKGLIARQFMLGVVQTAEGLPIYRKHPTCTVLQSFQTYTVSASLST